MTRVEWRVSLCDATDISVVEWRVVRREQLL